MPGRIISICNNKTAFGGLDVTDRDKPTGWVKTTTKVPVPFVVVFDVVGLPGLTYGDNVAA